MIFHRCLKCGMYWGDCNLLSGKRTCCVADGNVLVKVYYDHKAFLWLLTTYLYANDAAQNTSSIIPLVVTPLYRGFSARVLAGERSARVCGCMHGFDDLGRVYNSVHKDPRNSFHDRPYCLKSSIRVSIGIASKQPKQIPWAIILPRLQPQWRHGEYIIIFSTSLYCVFQGKPQPNLLGYWHSARGARWATTC